LTSRAINAKLDALFVEGPDDGAVVNAFIQKLTGADLATRARLVRTKEQGGGASWALRAFDDYVAAALDGARVGLILVAGIVPSSPVLEYAVAASRIAKEEHGAEYDPAHVRKAVLKIRSVWRDASAAGGYGHLVRNLPLEETAASRAFLAWFRELFLT
jgi:hypothetical protein